MHRQHTKNAFTKPALCFAFSDYRFQFSVSTAMDYWALWGDSKQRTQRPQCGGAAF